MILFLNGNEANRVYYRISRSPTHISPENFLFIVSFIINDSRLI